jgi:co-chaperonin GroES (HSP10)
MEIQALGSTVVLKQHSKETTMGSLGLVMPSKFANEKTVGDVVSVGPDFGQSALIAAGAESPEPQLKKGDTVVFRNAQRTTLDDEDYLFVKEEDVLAIIRI